MTGAVRKEDRTSGHGSFPPQDVMEGSPNVFVNGKPVARVGDKVNSHTDGLGSHDGSISQGSPNVFVNGKPKARRGDSVSCGGTLVDGSSNVLVN